VGEDRPVCRPFGGPDASGAVLQRDGSPFDRSRTDDADADCRLLPWHPFGASAAFRKKLTREKVLGFLAEQPRCVVAMEAYGSAHHWAIRDAGHEVRLIPPAYVKPFVKRQKNDAAEAIAEAAT
jgi:hypothetical protein